MNVDVSRLETWPEPLISAVAAIDRKVPRSPYPADLAVPAEAIASLWGAIGGHHLVARHFTRLLEHEAEAILACGLRLYSRELFDERIDDAVRLKLMPLEVGEALKESSLPAVDPAGTRRGKRRFVWMTVGHTIEEQPSSAAPLMESWGGEGIFRADGIEPHKPFLQGLGHPAIVHLLLPAEQAREMKFFPGIGRVLLASYRHLGKVSADVSSVNAIPPEAVERVELLA